MMTAEQLKASILQLAMQGILVEQRSDEGTGEELFQQIQAEKRKLEKSGRIKKEKPLPRITEEEIPFEIPIKWKWVRWGELSESIQYGYNAPAKETGRIKMVRISDIQDGRVLWDSVPYCDIEEESISSYLIESNDILFARTGGTVGKSYLVKTVPEESIYAGYLIRTRYSKKLCPEYMKFFMDSQLYWNQLRGGTIATAQPNCNGKTLSKMILPLPPLAEQKRIVAKIEELMPFVEQYADASSKLNTLNVSFPEMMKKSILQEAVQGKLVPQDPNDEPASVLLEKIAEEKKRLIKEEKIKKQKSLPAITDDEIPFDIPESWEWIRMGELITYQNGYAYKSSDMTDHGFPVIKSGNLMTLQVVLKPNNDYIANPTEKMLDSKIVKGDMLMCLSSQSNNPEPLGKTAIYSFDEPALLNQRVLKMRPIDERLTAYLYYTINSEYFHYTVSHQGGGSAQANLKLEHVLNMLIPVPPIKEQERIVVQLQKVFPNLSVLKRQVV